MSDRRYLALSSIIVAAGGLIVVTSFAFNQSAANWIALGLAVIALTGAVASLAVLPSGASLYRVIAAVVGVIAAFTIVASVGVFSGGTQHWIEVGAGVAAVALASLAAGRYVAGLVESTSVEGSAEMPEPLRAAA